MPRKCIAAAASARLASRIYSLASNITSLFALFIGMFIIYNTFAIAVTQRRGEIGILRALGATRSQIRTLFLTESAVAGGGRLRHRDGARHGGIHRHSAGRRVRHRAAGRTYRDRSLADRRSGRNGCNHQPDRSGNSRAQRRRSRPGEGFAEGPLSIDERGRKSPAQKVGAGMRGGLRRDADAQSEFDDLLCGLPAGGAGRGTAVARAGALAGANIAAGVRVDPGRDQRIALQDRSTRFFGTDFSFEDLEERDVNSTISNFWATRTDNGKSNRPT